jgi:riboflavin synthase
VTLNLTIKNATSSTFTTSACDSYYWPAKNKTYTISNNTDTVKLINTAGCDSIVTLNLTIKNSNSSTFTISACGSYYWPAKNKSYTTSNNTDTVKLINAAGCDSIVTLNLTIKNALSSSSTFTISACGSYYWAIKNKTYTISNNSDTVKLINAAGCDSIVTLSLTIYPNPIPTIIKTGNVLSTQYYNSYQWLLNGVNIIGATTQSYTVVVSGNYQVVVTDTNNCSGASSIGAVILSSLNEAGKDYFKIYPNPSEKMLHIETNASGNWQAIITDVKGSQINQIHFNKSTQLDISNYSPGVYYIQLTGKENVLNYKFMKK